MTTFQITAMTCAYAVALAAVVYLTRATFRRVAGALAGDTVAGCIGVGAMVLGQALAVWWISLPSTPGIWVLLYVGSRSRFRRSISSLGVWHGNLGGTVWQCVLSLRESLARREIIFMPRSTQNGWCSRKAWLRSWPTQRRIWFRGFRACSDVVGQRAITWKPPGATGIRRLTNELSRCVVRLHRLFGCGAQLFSEFS